MRLFTKVFLAVALVLVMVYPAVAVVISTNSGFADAPQLATPVGHITLFLTHSNGTKYRVTTNSRGLARADIPVGTIYYCQAYSEDRLLSNGPCNIPIGQQAINIAADGNGTAVNGETPMPLGSRPNSIVRHVRGGKQEGPVVNNGWDGNAFRAPASFPELVFQSAMFMYGKHPHDTLVGIFFSPLGGADAQTETEVAAGNVAVD